MRHFVQHTCAPKKDNARLRKKKTIKTSCATLINEKMWINTLSKKTTVCLLKIGQLCPEKGREEVVWTNNQFWKRSLLVTLGDVGLLIYQNHYWKKPTSPRHREVQFADSLRLDDWWKAEIEENTSRKLKLRLYIYYFHSYIDMCIYRYIRKTYTYSIWRLSVKCMTNSFCSMKSVYFIVHKPASSKVETTSINAFVPFANASNSDRTCETTMLRFVTSNPRIHIAQLQVRSIVPIIPFVLRKRTILIRWSVNTLMHTFQQVQSKCWCSSEWYEYD